MTQVPEGAIRSRHPIGRVCNVLAIVLGILALFLAPVITGVVAVLLGIVGYLRDRPLGRWALLIAVAGAVAGMVLYYGVRGHDFLQLY
jgi:hypothetical protein